ncbi:unnamed protein product [Rotaria magnacalcarata]|uniref:Uncharacterized protein n=1 Tax=Rotaria magnacalcarata TaxID=392030 RepID=A0A820UJE1_9BILA|nr:unnamed protein product [Rotaria magnacalcarata]CAF4484481.1 unnamed protein product [Rotaria magnacalcarata]
MPKKLALAFVLAAASTLALAQTALPTAVQNYIHLLASTEASTSAVSIAPVYQAALDAQTALMQLTSTEQTVVETLSDSEFENAQNTLRGMVIARGYEIYANPEPNFFAHLAEKHGLPEDISFFQLTAKASGEKQIPAYLKDRATTPCVRYGEHIITELYENWQRYQRRWPLAYTQIVQQNLTDLEEVYSKSSVIFYRAIHAVASHSKPVRAYYN